MAVGKINAIDSKLTKSSGSLICECNDLALSISKTTKSCQDGSATHFLYSCVQFYLDRFIGNENHFIVVFRKKKKGDMLISPLLIFCPL